ncbi:hypothetical protein AGMMS50229_17960 [Campylobacterota bacterium]|nr:hypothetical protein AGMMS50229_17960 [Campylobacterota bacterium]
MLQLKARYAALKADLTKELGVTNAMLLPKLDKIVISVGTGEGSKDQKLLQNIADTISIIAGQKAVITQAKKSVATFKIREGMNVGVRVTLRGKQMFNFLEKFIAIAAPRIKDFRGLPRSVSNAC